MTAYNIAHFGAFNINSFGDSMFPFATKKELQKSLEINNYILFSPIGVENAYNHNGKVYSYSEFEKINSITKIDFIIIGGGELFHFKDISFDDKKNKKITFSDGDIWKIPVELANRNDIPFMIYGVGVPYEFNNLEKEILDKILKNIYYIGVRDKYSYDRLRGIESLWGKVHIAPDSLWTIKKYFSLDKLIEIRNGIISKQLDRNRKYMILQYGTTYKYKEVANQINTISELLDYEIILMPINFCHEDLHALELIYNELNRDVLFCNQLLQPDEIIALISGAHLFIGTSLHGLLVAESYGVANFAIDMYGTFISKIDGILEWMNKPNNIILEPELLFSNINNMYYNEKNNGIESELAEKAQHEYSKIAFIINNKQVLKNETVKQEYTEIENSKIYIIVYSDESTLSLKCLGKNKNSFYEFKCILEENLKIRYIDLVIPLNSVIELKNLECIINNQKCEYNCVNFVNAVTLCLEKKAIINIHSTFLNELFIKFEIANDVPKDLYRIFYESYNNKLEDNRLLEKDLLQSKSNYDYVNNKYLEVKDKLIENKRMLNENDDKLCEYEKNKSQLEEIICNKEGHIEQLILSERSLKSELETIKSSKLFRMISMIVKVENFLFPINSRRRFFISILLRCIKHPIRTMRKFSVRRLKSMLKYMNEEDIQSVSQRFNECVGAMSLEQPLLIDKIEDITSIDECDEIIFDNVENPIVSIIIPVYNQFTFTYHCLKSILQNSGDIKYEIIIADDCSNDLTISLSEKVKNINIIRTSENLRFLKNCNNAARYAKGKYILFLNNDTQVQENWLEPLISLCESDESIGLVGSKLVYADGRLQEAGGIIWSDGSGWNYGNRQDASLPEFNYVKEVDYISGASIMIRTALWNMIGGFDERFAPAYCEDSDLAFTVRKEGYRVVFQPKSVVVHFEGISNGTDTNSGIKKYQIENSKKLYEKWVKEYKNQYPNSENVFRARERSRDKKIIVMIDHYVPHYDHDAGSKTIFQYLQMFIKQGFIVKFIGDNFYQHEPYTSVLQLMGIEVLYGSYYADHIFDWIKNNKDNIDFIFLNRPHISIKYIDYIKRETNIKTIYYGHDLHFLRNKREYELTGDRKKLKESDEWKEKELYLMNAADISFYPSKIEVDEILAIDPHIPVKAITAYVFDKFKDKIESDFTKREGILFVGGFGHDPNLDAVLWFTKEILPEIRKSLEIPFYIVGSKAPNTIKELDGNNGIVVKGFVSDEELEQLYDACKIVVVPLRYGAGVKGKVIEAIYNGLPIVTTATGAEGINGADDILVVEDDSVKFADSVVNLYQDTERMKSMSIQTQEFIKENFSIEAVWNIIKDDFR